MFPRSYFAGVYFAPVYFPQSQGNTPPQLISSGCDLSYPYGLPWTKRLRHGMRALTTLFLLRLQPQ